jgi:hypothetical protein
VAVTRTRFEVADARGWRFAEVPALLRDALHGLLERGAHERAQVLKPERVWRVDAWVVKRTPPWTWVQRYLRRAAAFRAAHAALRLERFGTPQPIAALARRRGGALRDSWLVSRFVDGLDAARAIELDAASTAALGASMAALHAAGVLHGDLNHQNLLWDGSRWVLIDLEALRGPLHRLRLRRIAEEQWAHLSSAMHPLDRLQPCFADYAARVGRTDVEPAWRRVQEMAQMFARRRAERRLRLGLPPEVTPTHGAH